MVVVTDTSPIDYLILTGYVDVLPVLRCWLACRHNDHGHPAGWPE
jgi:hypothetical protein